ncbi:MAG: cell division protein FtsZ, partial [Sphingomonadales bacterium]|nr:cell division protein FtsZ [Sphingomonadales bacterium]
LINLDFADVRSVMGEMGKAMMGTGEGHGENRALEAAERAIANPLLDGVSMQGAKGVIISIIGGDDMKLLEVDEAANHIRELVDPNANIIWGSAFNPDLQGKIRVSVVATGIEQSAEMAEMAARPLSLASSRGPSRPAIVTPPAPQPVFEPVPAPVAESEAARAEPETAPVANDLDLDGFTDDADAFELTDEDAGEPAEEEAKPGFASLMGVRSARAEALDLGAEQADEPVDGDAGTGGQDELLLDANRLAQEDALVSPLVTRKRGFGAPGAGSRAPVAGNTLFERMANLSRGVKPASAEEGEEDDDEDDGSAVSIPRFLGRQNNQ